MTCEFAQTNSQYGKNNEAFIVMVRNILLRWLEHSHQPLQFFS